MSILSILSIQKAVRRDFRHALPLLFPFPICFFRCRLLSERCTRSDEWAFGAFIKKVGECHPLSFIILTYTAVEHLLCCFSLIRWWNTTFTTFVAFFPLEVAFMVGSETPLTSYFRLYGGQRNAPNILLSPLWWAAKRP